jgi:hypothetical protein
MEGAYQSSERVDDVQRFGNLDDLIIGTGLQRIYNAKTVGNRSIYLLASYLRRDKEGND